MSLPSAYLTSVKNVKEIFEAMQSAQAPKKFTTAFLQGLGFKGTADRLIIGVLKAIGFLNSNGEPSQRYYEFLDQTQSDRVLGDGIMDAYADLFQVNKKAYELSTTEIKNKLKTLTQGQFSDSVLDKMASTFKTLSSLADFSAAPKTPQDQVESVKSQEHAEKPNHRVLTEHPPLRIGGLVYSIQIQLPESRDQAVYDALFKSLREHLS